MKQERFAILDTWRGVCASLVALGHCTIYGHLFDLHFVRGAYLWVDFFFVLSGFVITHAYGERVSSWRQVKAFMLRRFGRL